MGSSVLPISVIATCLRLKPSVIVIGGVSIVPSSVDEDRMKLHKI